MYDLYNYVRIRLVAKAKTERGASAVEYGLLVALIAIIIIVAVSTLGTKLSGVFQKTADSLPSLLTGTARRWSPRRETWRPPPPPPPRSSSDDPRAPAPPARRARRVGRRVRPRRGARRGGHHRLGDAAGHAHQRDVQELVRVRGAATPPAAPADHRSRRRSGDLRPQTPASRSTAPAQVHGATGRRPSRPARSIQPTRLVASGPSAGLQTSPAAEDASASGAPPESPTTTGRPHAWASSSTIPHASGSRPASRVRHGIANTSPASV